MTRHHYPRRRRKVRWADVGFCLIVLLSVCWIGFVGWVYLTT